MDLLIQKWSPMKDMLVFLLKKSSFPHSNIQKSLNKKFFLAHPKRGLANMSCKILTYKAICSEVPLDSPKTGTRPLVLFTDTSAVNWDHSSRFIWRPRLAVYMLLSQQLRLDWKFKQTDVHEETKKCGKLVHKSNNRWQCLKM